MLGVPDELQGEVIAALVFLKEGAAASMGEEGTDLERVLRNFCIERLPKYKVRWVVLGG